MRKTTASVILTASIVTGAASAEVIFDYWDRSTAQDLRDCSDSIGEIGCSTSFISGYVEPIVDNGDILYSESYSPASLIKAADKIDESTNSIDHYSLLYGGFVGSILAGSIVIFASLEGAIKKSGNKVATVASV